MRTRVSTVREVFILFRLATVFTGDRLHKQYRIIHKLGHGTFATVWLAVDEQNSRYTAIKLGTADADGQEEEYLSQLTKGLAATVSRYAATGAPLIPIVFDRFSLHGPNGIHHGLVTVHCTGQMQLGGRKRIIRF